MVAPLRSLCLQVVNDNIEVYQPDNLPDTLANEFAKLSLKLQTVTEKTQAAWGQLTEFCPEYNLPEKTLQAIFRTHGATIKSLKLHDQSEFRATTFGDEPFVNLQEVDINVSRMLRVEFAAFCKILPAGMQQLMLRNCNSRRMDPLIEAHVPKIVRFVDCTITTQQLAGLCSKAATVLEGLYFVRCTLEGEQVVIPKMTKLTACGIIETTNGYLLLKTLNTAANETIVNLGVGGSGVSCGDLESFYTVCSKFPFLQRLAVHDYHNLSEAWLLAVSSQCGKTLRSLSVTECQHLEFRGCEFPNLEELEVSYLTNEKLDHISAAVGNRLIKLIAKGSTLSFISTFPFSELRYLDLSRGNISNDDLSLIGRSCGISLEYLNIRACTEISTIDEKLFTQLKQFEAKGTKIPTQQSSLVLTRPH